MNDIEKFIQTAERFSLELSLLNRRDLSLAEDIEGTHPDDTQGLESLMERRLELDRSLFRIRNELDQAAKAAINTINDKEAKIAITKTTLAAWHYWDRFQVEWFTCHAILRSVNSESTTDHPYKVYYLQYISDNPGLRYPEAKAAKAYWHQGLCKNVRSELVANEAGNKEAAIKAFVKRFKYRLK